MMPRLWVLLLIIVCLVSLSLRWVSARHYGQDWFSSGGFTLVNFDEGGSCRAQLGSFPYSTFVGKKTIALASFFGHSPPSSLQTGESLQSGTDEATSGSPGVGSVDAQARRYCHGEAHLLVARGLSAWAGAATVLLTALITLQLLPGRHGTALTAAAMLSLSGWHISESMVGTVDAVSCFFIYAFFSGSLLALHRGRRYWWLVPPLLLAAIWTKYWVFALLASPAFLPIHLLMRMLGGISLARLFFIVVVFTATAAVATNSGTPETLKLLCPFALYLTIPWARLGLAHRLLWLAIPFVILIALQIPLFEAYSTGSLTGRFGTDYGAIGSHKYVRNLLNLPLVLLIGLGIPGFLAMGWGGFQLLRERSIDHYWLPLLPLLGFALYMASLAPVTYYRHYLPLLPAACIAAAVGLHSLPERVRSTAIVLCLFWQSALGWDLASDYHLDPRRQLPALLAREQPSTLLSSFYVNPPANGVYTRRLLRIPPDPQPLLDAYPNAILVLSENWYDTAFANELNGPVVDDVERLIKTQPMAVDFYRRAIDGSYPGLARVATLTAPTLMPELALHKAFYGSFTQFVGDLQVFRVSP